MHSELTTKKMFLSSFYCHVININLTVYFNNMIPITVQLLFKNDKFNGTHSNV